MSAKHRLFSLLLVVFLVASSRIDATAQTVPASVPAPGKQVVQSVELPASTSTWDAAGRAAIGEPRPLDQMERETVRYWLYLPESYEKQALSGGAPLLLFLHGAGERGNSPEEITKVKVHGPPKLLDEPAFQKNPDLACG